MAFFLSLLAKKISEFLVFWFKKEPHISQVLLKLWLIGNRTSCRPIQSVIILVIKQIGLPLRGRPILLITRMITDRIGLHSVLLPLLITWLLSGTWFFYVPRSIICTLSPLGRNDATPKVMWLSYSRSQCLRFWLRAYSWPSVRRRALGSRLINN